MFFFKFSFGLPREKGTKTSLLFRLREMQSWVKRHIKSVDDGFATWSYGENYMKEKKKRHATTRLVTLLLFVEAHCAQGQHTSEETTSIMMINARECLCTERNRMMDFSCYCSKRSTCSEKKSMGNSSWVFELLDRNRLFFVQNNYRVGMCKYVCVCIYKEKYMYRYIYICMYVCL